MAQNFALKTGKGCVAYENIESNATIYGSRYIWETSKKVCPSVWHLPSMEEWSALISYLGGDTLRE
jgi:uncharacterized protein (TIGR02145 family)